MPYALVTTNKGFSCCHYGFDLEGPIARQVDFIATLIGAAEGVPSQNSLHDYFFYPSQQIIYQDEFDLIKLNKYIVHGLDHVRDLYKPKFPRI